MMRLRAVTPAVFVFALSVCAPACDTGDPLTSTAGPAPTTTTTSDTTDTTPTTTAGFETEGLDCSQDGVCPLPFACNKGTCRLVKCPDGTCAHPDEFCYEGLCHRKRAHGERCLPEVYESDPAHEGVNLYQACMTGMCAQVTAGEKHECVGSCTYPNGTGLPEFQDCKASEECASPATALQAEGEDQGWCYPVSSNMFTPIGEFCPTVGDDPVIEGQPGHCISGWCSVLNTCEWKCEGANTCPYHMLCQLDGGTDAGYCG